MTSPLARRFDAAARLLSASRDVLDARPGDDDDPPPGLVARGWAPFLASLDDAELSRLERGETAAWPERTPASLRELAARAADVSALPSLAPPSSDTHVGTRAAAGRRHERPRKQAQVDAFAALLVPLARHAARVVDVGSGHGHLTRAIAERIELPVVGLERDEALAGRARELAGARASPSFAVADVVRDGLRLAAGDCVIGLHACGELGDIVVQSLARTSERTSLAFVGCCLQKQRAPARASLCRDEAALSLPKAVLGLSNLTTRDAGVESSLARNLEARERRLAVARLLRGVGVVDVEPGRELVGLNRRVAHHDLASVVARAFTVRGLAVPSAAAILEAAAWASVQHARLRRLALPRTMLARVLEVFVVLDRGRFLEERGFVVDVGVLFSPDVSARNVVLTAMRS